MGNGSRNINIENRKQLKLNKMREIKFRGYRTNPVNQHRGWKIGNLLNNCSIGDVGSGLESYQYSEVFPSSIGQYTGLKDKNGVEIYEGDIVQSKKDDWSFSDGWSIDDERWEPYNKKEKQIPKIIDVTDIVVMDRFPTYWLKNESFGYEGEDLQNPDFFEVIGNIHENPELIN